MTSVQEWKELFEKMFPASGSAAAQRRKAKFVIDEQYKDEGKQYKGSTIIPHCLGQYCLLFFLPTVTCP